MDVPTLLALALSMLASIAAGAALYTARKTQSLLNLQAKEPNNQKSEHYSEIANMLSDGSLVWQQLVVQCDDLSAMLATSYMQGTTRESIGDWLRQLREFSKNAKTEIDQAYQLFASEAKIMSSNDMEMQRPDMEKFNKEMRSNVAAMADQLDHITDILRGLEPADNRQFKLTLHKPQVMPHFLRKRQKIAELQRRRLRPTSQVAP